MNKLKKPYAVFLAINVFAFLSTLFFFGCDSKNQATSPSSRAQIALSTVFVNSTPNTSKSKILTFSSRHDLRNEQKAVHKVIRSSQIVDRVTVTVINSNNETVVNVDLDIVQTAEGRFAEGNLSIPVNGDQETFLIDIKAFDDDNLVFAGNAQTTLTPGEVRAEPVVVTLQALGGGDVQVTLTWNTATDQDLHVIDPSGFRIFFADTLSPTGGTLDFDDTDGFGPENVFWASGQAPNGPYKIQVVYFPNDPRETTVTDVTVVVARSDAPTETFNGTLRAKGDTLDITEFTFTGGTTVLRSIAITPSDVSIAVAQTQQFNAIGTFSDNSTSDITNQVTWGSSDPNVASINAAGLATTVGTGTATITATQGAISGQASLFVFAPQLQSIAISPQNPAKDVGQTQQFTATGTLEDNSTSDITNEVVWASSDQNVATIRALGLATAIAAGTTTISATQGSISGETTLTVNAPQLQSIAISPQNPTIDVGQTQQFTATGTFSDNSTSDITNQVTWASSDQNLAAINSAGLATGVVPGTVTISATQGAIIGSTTLTVNAPQLQSIAISPQNPTRDVGQTQQFTATGTFSDNSTSDITSQVAWASSDPNVATINSAGLSTAIASGTTTISATQGNISDQTTLTVNAVQLSGATISNLQAPLTQLNNCTLADGSVGSVFQNTFNYTDPDGDVTTGTVVNVSFVFSPSGSAGSFDVTSPGITGDGFQGTITFGICLFFSDDTSVRVTVSITDAGNRVSNATSVDIQKPEGANSPPGGQHFRKSDMKSTGAVSSKF